MTTLIDEMYAIPENEAQELDALSDEGQEEKPSEWRYSVASIASRLKWWQAKQAALKAEYEPLMERIKDDLEFMQKKVEHYEQFLRWAVPTDSDYVDDKVSVFYTESTRTHVFDAALVPLEFCTQPEPRPDVAAIKRALKINQEVPGASLVKVHNLQVKEGGEKARQAQKRRAKKREDSGREEFEAEMADIRDGKITMGQP